MTNQTYTPPETQEKLILSWIKRTRESQFAHYECQRKYEKRHLWLGVPSMIMTTLSGASVVKLLQQNAQDWIKFLAISLALCATLLTALQTFLNNEGKARLHQEAGARYGSLRRKLELLYAEKKYNSNEMSKLEKEISILAIRSPGVSVDDFQKAKKSMYI